MTYTQNDCQSAISRIASKVGGKLSRRQYTELRKDSDPSASTITYQCGGWNQAKESIGVEVITRDKNVNEDYFEKIDEPEKAYWLGMLMGDGSIYYNQNDKITVKLALKESDKHIIHEFKKVIGSEHNISYTDGTAKIAITNEKFVRNITKWEVDVNKTHKGTVPSFNKESNKRAFVRGISDADGTLPTGGNYTIYNWKLAGSSIPRLEAIKEWIPVEAIINEDSNKGNLFLKNPKRNIKYLVNYLYPDGEETQPALERKKSAAMKRLEHLN